MNFFKRATTSITRRPGKTVILLLLVFILGTVIAGAISVRGAINNTDANLRSRMQPIVAISFDHGAFNESVDWDSEDDPWATRPRMTPGHVRALADLEYVAFYDFMIQGGMRSFDMERFTGDEQSWRDQGTPEWFNLRGTSNTNMIQFESGAMNLVQGTQFDSGHLIPGGNNSHAIISQEFANQNGLSIGSTFTLAEFVMNPRQSEWGDVEVHPWQADDFLDENIFARIEMDFTVLGIYERPFDEEEDDLWQHNHALNDIFVPNWAIEAAMVQTSQAILAAFATTDYEMPSWVESSIMSGLEDTEVLSFYIIDNPANIEAFRTLATPLLPDFHEIEDMSNAFSDIESSMATMQGIADVVLWVSVGATLLILSLLITLFLRDRRYEMGVYLALGEKKGNIVTQILLEVVVTAFVGITLAVFSGHFISSAMSNNMLMNELQANQGPTDPWGGGGMISWDIFDQIGIPNNDMTIHEMAEAFQVRLGADTIMLFYGVGIGAVVLSTLLPVIYVVTLKPKKVLM